MEQPFVSVIIPVLNVSNTIENVLDSLTSQSYTERCYEIIIVDNGSTDNTLEKVETYPVKLLIEDNIRSPYAARNKGLANAQGTIIAFTDGNKIPAKNWIEKGIGCIKNENDLIGGKVEFTFSDNKSLGEIYDSITYLNNEKYVKEQSGALGGNLFVKKEVFEQMGDFPSDYRSGMDIYWSRRAVDEGFRIGYCPDAIVFSVARKLKSVLKKAYRVGIGHPLTIYNSEKNVATIFFQTLAVFLPPSSKDLRQKIDKRGKAEYHNFFYSLWCIEYSKRVAMGIGRIAGIFKIATKFIK